MVSGTKRNPAFPDVPSAAEVGLPDYTVTTWYGLWAPKGTPADVQARIVDEVRKAMPVRRAQGDLGQQRRRVPQPHASSSSAASSSAEIKRWAAVVKASGAKLD